MVSLSTPNPVWRTVANWQDLQHAPHMIELPIDDQVLLLIRDGDSVLALQGLCPHQFAQLSTGHIDDNGWLHCPRHQASFALADGRCGPGWQLPALRRYTVRRDGEYVQMPSPLQLLR